jgi:carbamate kinase
VILTEVACVYRNWRKSNQEEIRKVSAEEAEALLSELPEGSMRPKVEAAVELARVGRETLITSSAALAEALEGRAGTTVAP